MSNRDMYSDIIGLYYAALGHINTQRNVSKIYMVRGITGHTCKIDVLDEMRRISELMKKEGTNELYQCPYETACRCRMDEPCKGCETWSKAQTAQDAAYVRKTTKDKACHVMNPHKITELSYCWHRDDVVCENNHLCARCIYYTERNFYENRR